MCMLNVSLYGRYANLLLCKEGTHLPEFFCPYYRPYTRAVPGVNASLWTLKSSRQESHTRTTSLLSTDTASPLSASTRAALGMLSHVLELVLGHKVTG